MRKVATVALVALVALVLAACLPPYEGPAGTPRVAFVSDSVIGMAEDLMIPNLRLDRQVSWGNTNAAKVAGLQGVADEVAGSDPDVVVISAGTNDVFARVAPAQTIAQLQAMVAKFSRSCVTIVTLNTNITDDDVKARSQQVNDWIRTWPQVADWDAWVTAYYAIGSPVGPLFYDLIHVMPVGKPYLTNVINGAARRCLNRGWPMGFVDSTSSPTAGALRVRGWTLDPDTNNPIAAHVYVDGAFAGQVTANGSRPDVGSALPFGPNHGFDTTVSASPGQHRVRLRHQRGARWQQPAAMPTSRRRLSACADRRTDQ
jgi:hypothetical protein